MNVVSDRALCASMIALFSKYESSLRREVGVTGVSGKLGGEDASRQSHRK